MARKIEGHTLKCRLQEWIDEKGLNYSVVAQQTGLNISTVRLLSKQQFDRVDCATWQTLCRYFDRDISELFYEDS